MKFQDLPKRPLLTLTITGLCWFGACSEDPNQGLNQVGGGGFLLPGDDSAGGDAGTDAGSITDTAPDEGGPEVGVDTVVTGCQSAADCPQPDSPCEVARCNPAGVCQSVASPDGTACDDGNACTEQDACAAGSCLGAPLACPVSGPCRLSECDPIKGCAEVDAPDGLACDDGNPCTDDDTCGAGACLPGPNTCQCQSDDECAEQQTSQCQAPLVCDAGQCVAGGPPVQCPPSTDPCQESVCDDAQGCVLVAVADGTSCDSGQPCLGATCLDGACVALPGLPCDDNDACTDDACDAATGQCVNTPVSCDDGNACTTDSCDPATGCLAQAVPDGTPCTSPLACATDMCVSGQCESMCGCGSDAECDDGDACTDDVCDVATASCSSSPVSCDDGDDCTADSCDPLTGCANTAIAGCGDGQCDNVQTGSACNDGDPQTTADICMQGSCAGFRQVADAVGNDAVQYRHTRIGRVGDSWFIGRQQFGNDPFPTGYGGLIMAADDPDASTEMPASAVSEDFFRDIFGGYAVTYGGKLFVLESDGWNGAHPLAQALQDSGAGTNVRHVWGFATGVVTTVWVAGGNPAYIRRCESNPLNPGQCTPQTLPDTFQSTWRPRATRGHVVCGGAGGCSPVLVMAADDTLFQGQAFNSVFSNPGGQQTPWSTEFNDPQAGPTEVQDMAGDGDGNYLIVGSGGFMRLRAAGGTVSNSFNTVVPFQPEMFLGGAWFGAGAWMAVGTRDIPGPNGNGQREMWLLVAPEGSDLTQAASWNSYLLATDAQFASGIFDVWGDDAGQVRGVGATYNGTFTAQPTQWVRQP